MIGGTCPLTLNEGIFFDCEKNEITYATTERGINLKYRAQFAFDIAFGEVGPLKGYSVPQNLDGMIRAVTAIVDKTEAKCGELRLFS
jgi:hypothetical protein